jgi:hypothetical protein
MYLWYFVDQFMSRRTDRMAQDQRRAVYVSREPWIAPYYKSDINFLDSLLLGLRDHVALIVLPRGRAQGAHYRAEKFKGIGVGRYRTRPGRHSSGLRFIYRRSWDDDPGDGSARYPNSLDLPIGSARC